MGSVNPALSMDLFPKASILKPSITSLLLAVSVSEYYAGREHWLRSNLHAGLKTRLVGNMF